MPFSGNAIFLPKSHRLSHVPRRLVLIVKKNGGVDSILVLFFKKIFFVPGLIALDEHGGRTVEALQSNAGVRENVGRHRLVGTHDDGSGCQQVKINGREGWIRPYAHFRGPSSKAFHQIASFYHGRFY